MPAKKQRSERKAKPSGQVVGRSLDPIVRPCRHRHFWIMSGGHLLWCYECGAVRNMKVILNTNECAPLGCWVKPTGIGGDNPWTDKFNGPNDKAHGRETAKENE